MIDFDAVQRLNVQDGDLLVVPPNSDQHDMEPVSYTHLTLPTTPYV